MCDLCTGQGRITIGHHCLIIIEQVRGGGIYSNNGDIYNKWWVQNNRNYKYNGWSGHREAFIIIIIMGDLCTAQEWITIGLHCSILKEQGGGGVYSNNGGNYNKWWVQNSNRNDNISCDQGALIITMCEMGIGQMRIIIGHHWLLMIITGEEEWGGDSWNIFNSVRSTE